MKVLKLFKVDKLKGGLKKIEDLKWLEYYNMHITGGYIKKIKFKKIKKGIMEAIGPITNDKPKQASHDKDEEKKDFMDGKADSEGNYCCSGCSYVFCFVCFILEACRIIAQRATVPLLMVQAFDTYAFLCFTGNEYCSETTQYDIPLSQAAFTFAFSVSIMVSTLTVAMLKWFNYECKEFLCCCKDSVNCSEYKWIQSCI